MTKILFVCHGNICRSPMAELYMKDLVRRCGCEGRYEIASAATSSEELGNPVYPPARRKLAEHGVGCEGKTARRLRASDAVDYDLLIGMDEYNLRNMRRALGDAEGKLRLLLDYAGRAGEAVADPWYTDDFETAWRDIREGCLGLLETLEGCPVIELEGCVDRKGLYERVYTALGAQDWYSPNLDALWDVLTGEERCAARYLLALPRDSSPVYEHARRVRELFAEAGALK